MKGKVRVLPPEVAYRIAAGEVIFLPRPFGFPNRESDELKGGGGEGHCTLRSHRDDTHPPHRPRIAYQKRKSGGGSRL